jgi:hypothetical protein
LLRTRKHRKLIERTTKDAFHRRMTYEEIAQIEGIQACQHTLMAAFKKEMFYRHIAAEKPFLTLAHKIARIIWAQVHVHWDLTCGNVLFG